MYVRITIPDAILRARQIVCSRHRSTRRDRGSGERRTARDARVVMHASSIRAFTRADRRDDGGGRERMDDDEEYEWVFVRRTPTANDRDAADDDDDAREEGSRHRHRCDASSSADADDEVDAREDVSEVSEASRGNRVDRRARETASRRKRRPRRALQRMDSWMKRCDGFELDWWRRSRRVGGRWTSARRRWRRTRRLFDTMTRRWKDRSLARDVGVDIVCVTTAAGVILVHRQFFGSTTAVG